jgi:hypothetical protein
MATQTSRRAVSILLPRFPSKTGPSATVFHARSVRLVIHKEHKVRNEEFVAISRLSHQKYCPTPCYRVSTRQNRHHFVAYSLLHSKESDQTLAGDRVSAEVSPYDLEKERLIFRRKETDAPDRLAVRHSVIDCGGGGGQGPVVST